MAETRGEADKAYDFFVEAYGVKYDKAVVRLVKDRERLLSFYDFRLSLGSTSAPPTRSSARSPRCACEP